MTPPGESNSDRAHVRVWHFEVDGAVWEFYDDKFRGAVRQWLDVMDALCLTNLGTWMPSPRGDTRIVVRSSELARR